MCLGGGITLISLKLKNIIRTHRCDCIIKKAERNLSNERVRNINNTLDWLDHDRYMYELKLLAILDPDLMEEYKGFMKELKEARHMKVMEHQNRKIENYGAENNIVAVQTSAKVAQVATQTRTNFQLSSIGL